MEPEPIIDAWKKIREQIHTITQGQPNRATPEVVCLASNDLMQLVTDSLTAFDALHERFLDEARRALTLEAERENFDEGYRAGLVSADVPKNKATNSAWMQGWRSAQYFSVAERLAVTARGSEVRRMLYAEASRGPRS